jgi:hypothetical protein
MTTQDGTEYVPIESVYAIGEIKSTYYRSKNYIEGFSDTICHILTQMEKELIPNTACGGINEETTLRDILLARANPVLNQLFAFMLFIDSNDFRINDVTSIFNNREKKYLPNATVFLDKGVIHCAHVADDRINANRYPEWSKHEHEGWCFCPYYGGESGSLEGNHLGFLYYWIIEHLNSSFIEPPPLWKYTSSMMVSRKSMIQRL